jgi:predicted enzyme related to lactoylglutathione lyase
MTTTTSSSSLPLAVNWFEIAVSDLSRATTLYESTFDTTLKVAPFNGIPHAIFQVGERSFGALIVDPNRPVRAGHSTVIYLQVSNVKDALGRALEAGAKIVQPETSIGPQGTIGLFADLDGNVVGLHTPVK